MAHDFRSQPWYAIGRISRTQAVAIIGGALSVFLFRLAGFGLSFWQSVWAAVIAGAILGLGALVWRVIVTRANPQGWAAALSSFSQRHGVQSLVLFILVGAGIGGLLGAALWAAVRKPTKQLDSVGLPQQQPPATPDKPVVRLDTAGAFLVVHNEGAPAVFRARLLVTHAQEFPSVKAGSHFEGIWMTTLTDKSEIATGDSDRLMLGAVSGDHDPGVAPFHFYDVATGKMGVRQARQLPDRAAPALSLDLTLVSVPAMAGGPKTYELTVLQGRVEFLQEKPF